MERARYTLKITTLHEFWTPLTCVHPHSDAPNVVRTPESSFFGLEALGYTFEPHYASLPVGGGVSLPRMHYVDEGETHTSKEDIIYITF